MTATARPTFDDILAAARRDPVLWEQVHASRVDYGSVPEMAVCGECGEALNVKPIGTDRDGYQTRDLWFIPWEGGVFTWAAVPPRKVLRQKLGSVNVCKCCLLEPSKAAARAKRRARIKHTGNYING